MDDPAPPYLNLHVPPDEMVQVHSGSDDAAAWRDRGRFGDDPGAAPVGRRHAAGARRAAALGSAESGISGQAIGDLDGQRASATVSRCRPRWWRPPGSRRWCIDNERAVFDIPALLDATLEFQPPAGQGLRAHEPPAKTRRACRALGCCAPLPLYKLLKVSLLLLAAYGELHLHDASLSAKLLSWAADRPAGTRARRGEAGASSGSAA